MKVKTYWPYGVGLEIDDSTTPGATQLLWSHVDRLGSPVALSDEGGNLVEKLAYDAWGKRRTLDGAPINGTVTPDNIDGVLDNRGFTGHEMLDQLDLVHMNGRIYDPFIAKFLSGDPLIQDPMNGQNYSRYSYVLNNPTNLTDPTGFADSDAEKEKEKEKEQQKEKEILLPCDPTKLFGPIIVTDRRLPKSEDSDDNGQNKSSAKGGGSHFTSTTGPLTGSGVIRPGSAAAVMQTHWTSHSSLQSGHGFGPTPSQREARDSWTNVDAMNNPQGDNALGGDAVGMVIFAAEYGSVHYGVGAVVSLAKWGLRVRRLTPAIDIANLPFRSGEIIVKEFNTSKGIVDMAAEVQISGKTLHLKDIAVFPRGKGALQLGAREVALLRNQLASEASALGFEYLRITGTRVSGANPGKSVDLLIDLWKFVQ